MRPVMTDIESAFSEIERCYSFRLPPLFREIWRLGFCSGDTFLIMPDMEWMPLQDIIDYRFEDYQLPGLVPFAFTAGGDLWCWQAVPDALAEPHVVECPHDCEEGSVYAPDFQTAIYRHLLEAAAGQHIAEQDLLDEVELIRQCCDRFRSLLSQRQAGKLDEVLSRSPQSAVLPARRPTRWHFLLSREEGRQLRADFPATTFRWMTPPTS